MLRWNAANTLLALAALAVALTAAATSGEAQQARQLRWFCFAQDTDLTYVWDGTLLSATRAGAQDLAHARAVKTRSTFDGLISCGSDFVQLADDRYVAAASHSHAGLAAASHAHAGFAASSHVHDGFAAASHTHEAAAPDAPADPVPEEEDPVPEAPAPENPAPPAESTPEATATPTMTRYICEYHHGPNWERAHGVDAESAAAAEASLLARPGVTWASCTEV